MSQAKQAISDGSVFDKMWAALPEKDRTAERKIAIQKALGIYVQAPFVKYTYQAKEGDSPNPMFKVLRTSGKGTKYYGKGISIGDLDKILADLDAVVAVKDGPVSYAQVGNGKDE